MQKKILDSNGNEYMTAVAIGESIEFRNFGDSHYTISFDARVLDQLLPFLNEVNFWRKVGNKNAVDSKCSTSRYS